MRTGFCPAATSGSVNAAISMGLSQAACFGGVGLPPNKDRKNPMRTSIDSCGPHVMGLGGIVLLEEWVGVEQGRLSGSDLADGQGHSRRNLACLRGNDRSTLDRAFRQGFLQVLLARAGHLRELKVKPGEVLE